jgi:hypothetical protein
MTAPAHPAAYIRIPGADSWARHAMIQAAAQRRWPAPVIYAEEEIATDGSYGPAMDRLDTAIAAGRHDALLIAMPGSPGQLMRVLSRCTKAGVTVSFLPAPAASALGATAADADTLWPDQAPPGEEWDVLAQARLEALTGLFPGWRIWLDRNGWHARRCDTFLQRRQPRAPAFHLSAGTALELAAQLCWQQAADAAAAEDCRLSAGSGTATTTSRPPSRPTPKSSPTPAQQSLRQQAASSHP